MKGIKGKMQKMLFKHLPSSITVIVVPLLLFPVVGMFGAGIVEVELGKS